MKKKIHIIFAMMLIAGAIGHAIAPEIYAPMIPDFISEKLANYLSIIFEGGIGFFLLSPKYRHLGGLGFMLLMIAFLPIHVWDLVREDPVIKPFFVAMIRVIIQFLMIYGGFWIYKTNKN